jgi:hypothetical protein
MNTFIELLKKHVPSFLKTYVAAFLAIVFFADSTGVDVFTLAFLVPAAKASLITTLRTVYKLFTEDVPRVVEGKSIAREYTEK